MFEDQEPRLTRAVVTAYDLAMESVHDGFCVALIPCESTDGRPVIYMRRHKPTGVAERGVVFHRKDKVRTAALTGLCVGAHLRLERAA